ncbi:MAG: YraN family protein [Tissierellia bacterium]|nr:YraN family protein [Tissierellia bacterium]
MKNNRKKGIIGEEIAAKYLLSKGYKIIDKNYRTNIGEIDIIALENDVLAFIEVKTRTSVNYGYPYEAVNWKKQDKIIKSSLIYIKHKNMRNYQIRYDIIEVYLINEGKINHIENAF